MQLTKTQHINLLNVLLLVCALIASIIHPLGTFLFAYAVLGPLHYLTEIPWLHKRTYFTTSALKAIPLYIIGILYLVLPLDNMGFTYLIALAFFWAVATSFAKSWLWQITLSLLGVFLLWTSGTPPFTVALFGVLLTTLIHVGVFTWLFMFSGVRKKPEWTGVLTLILLPAMTLLLLLPWHSIIPDSGLQQIYQSFIGINQVLLQTTSLDFIFTSDMGLALLRIIAFLYTYHYLNWFSKTGIIGWHKLPKSSLALIILLWIGSIALYVLDYTTGLKALLFLSVVHVFLEFPLNIQTMRSIFQR